MQIYKSFLKKKTTKIYILLMFSLWFGILMVNGINNYFKKTIQEGFSGSYLSIVMDKKYRNNLMKIKNISKMEENLIIKSSFPYLDFVIIKEDNHLKEEEAIASSIFYSYDLNLKDKINFENYTFVIKKIDNDLRYNEIKVSSEMFTKIEQEKDLREYKIILNNWLKKEKTSSKIENLKINENYGLIENVENKNDSNLNLIIYVMNISLLIIIGSLIILYNIVIISIFNDEKSFNKILKQLGFNRKKIISLNNFRIFFISIFSLILAIIFYALMLKVLRIYHISISFNVSFILKLMIILFVINGIYNLIYGLKRDKKQKVIK